jgi:hypothetical protein
MELYLIYKYINNIYIYTSSYVVLIYTFWKIFLAVEHNKWVDIPCSVNVIMNVLCVQSTKYLDIV